jgi:uncharacterized membrane protein YoaK (UPF0700 family)
MNPFFADIRQTVFPGPDSKDGPLAPLLVALTLVTGLVDAFSYLVLGHVFVANMTGNVVFLGFALVGARGFSITASVVAVAAFWFGALGGGRLASTYPKHRGRLLSSAVTIQAVFLAVSVALAAFSRNPPGAGFRYGLIVALGVAMGLQNATARKLAVADLTTTVLTTTIAGTAADSAIVGGTGSKAGRRLVAVAALLVGALLGAALVLHVQITLPLALALLLLIIIGITTQRLGRSMPAWVET